MCRISLFALIVLLLVGGQNVSAQTTGRSTLDRIRQTGTVRLAYRVDAPPFSYKSANTPQPIGFMIALCNGVVAQLPQLANLPAGLKVVYVPVTATDRFQAIQSGKADLLCDNTTMTITRRKLVDFSIPTFVDGAGLLVKGTGIANMSALAGQRVAVVSGTTTEAALQNSLSMAKITATVVAVPDYHAGLQALDAGNVAALFGDRSVLMFMIPQSQAPAQLAIADNYLTIEPYALAMQRGDEDFRLVVDQALSRIYRSGHIADVFKATFGQAPPPGALAAYNFVAYPE